MNVVLDTNVVISSFMKADTPPDQILHLFQRGTLDVVVDSRILDEYCDVIFRPRLKKWITPSNAVALLEKFQFDAVKIVAQVQFTDLPDPADAPFLEVAWTAQCPLITGNIKHFPTQQRYGVSVLTPAQFLEQRL